MLYAAKCYWPGLTDDEVESAAVLLDEADAGYVGSLVFPAEALVLCLFVAPRKEAVRKASERAHIPCERVMSTRWLGNERRVPC